MKLPDQAGILQLQGSTGTKGPVVQLASNQIEGDADQPFPTLLSIPWEGVPVDMRDVENHENDLPALDKLNLAGSEVTRDVAVHDTRRRIVEGQSTPEGEDAKRPTTEELAKTIANGLLMNSNLSLSVDVVQIHDDVSIKERLINQFQQASGNGDVSLASSKHQSVGVPEKTPAHEQISEADLFVTDPPPSAAALSGAADATQPGKQRTSDEMTMAPPARTLAPETASAHRIAAGMPQMAHPTSPVAAKVIQSMQTSLATDQTSTVHQAVANSSKPVLQATISQPAQPAEAPRSSQPVHAATATSPVAVKQVATETSQATNIQVSSSPPSKGEVHSVDPKPLPQVSVTKSENHVSFLQPTLPARIPELVSRVASQPQAFQPASRIAAEAASMADRPVAKIEVQLVPKNLGTVQISVQRQEGAVSIVIRAETVEAERILASETNAIRESLRSVGLTLDDLKFQPLPVADRETESRAFKQNGQENFFSQSMGERGTGSEHVPGQDAGLSNEDGDTIGRSGESEARSLNPDHRDGLYL